MFYCRTNAGKSINVCKKSATGTMDAIYYQFSDSRGKSELRQQFTGPSGIKPYEFFKDEWNTGYFTRFRFTIGAYTYSLEHYNEENPYGDGKTEAYVFITRDSKEIANISCKTSTVVDAFRNNLK